MLGSSLFCSLKSSCKIRIVCFLKGLLRHLQSYLSHIFFLKLFGKILEATDSYFYISLVLVESVFPKISATVLFFKYIVINVVTSLKIFKQLLLILFQFNVNLPSLFFFFPLACSVGLSCIFTLLKNHFFKLSVQFFSP